ncbi:PDDEXK nuclease domain-containing protein [Tumidithrix elongata RA019]|uniref:PDDEXK nuclease domain-containing protein n=1 Tax=Tumidithrix elongata BACA0141 TaxID=2716417 RepID=A0AAW9PX93_9CYAN|nr:PDDEXK nuclease domain-containing protein [Tumidithrix elongata RA019]
MKKERLTRGNKREGASLPIAPSKLELPEQYAELFLEIKTKVSSSRLRVVMSANSALVMLYWEIGQSILRRQKQEGWGAKVIDRLSYDLRDAFPDMQGFSPRNLLFMRAFAENYPDSEKVKQLVSQLPWGHIILLMQRVKMPRQQDWYMSQSILHGWSRNILALQISNQSYERQGKAVNNFTATLPPADSDMATQVFKDPYLFDFLGTADPRREREVEQALVDHIQKFLLELGNGFAFVGRQVHLEVGDSDFYIDLLFYHLKLRCYVVVELKVVPFDPAFVGTLNLYLSAVDDLLRHPDDKPTIGLLLCRSKSQLVVEYALRDFNKPIGVADWETQITRALPKELASSLPSIEEIEAELQSELKTN